MYSITEYQYQQLRNYYPDPIITEIGMQSIPNNLKNIIQNRINMLSKTRDVFINKNNIQTANIYEGKIELLKSILKENEDK
jgi:hypothetical protein